MDFIIIFSLVVGMIVGGATVLLIQYVQQPSPPDHLEEHFMREEMAHEAPRHVTRLTNRERTTEL